MARSTGHAPQAPQALDTSPTDGATTLDSQPHLQPSAIEHQISLTPAAASTEAAPHGAADAASPPQHRARSHALSMLTAALKASPMEPDDAAPPARAAAVSPPQQRQQVQPTPSVLASDEAGGDRPDRPRTPVPEARPPRRVLGRGLSGDPVLLESFLNAGMHAGSAEVRGLWRVGVLMASVIALLRLLLH